MRADAGVPVDIGRVQRLLAVRTFDGWARMPTERLAVIAEHSEARFFAKGSYLFREGQPITRMHMIIEGEVELRRHGHRLRRLGPKGTAGAMSMLARDPEGHDAIATQDTVTLALELDDTEHIFEDNFDILRAVLRNVAADIIHVRRSMDASAGFRDDIEEAPRGPWTWWNASSSFARAW